MSSLQNGLRLLGLIERGQSTLRVADASRALALPKSTVSRLLSHLARDGLLDRVGNGTYVVGSRIPALATLYKAQHPMVQSAENVVGELAASYGKIGYVSVAVGRDVNVLSVISRSNRRISGAFPGARRQIWEAAAGRAILAASHDANIELALEGARNVNQDEFYRKIHLARKQGYALAPCKSTSGVTSVSTVVTNHRTGEHVALVLDWERDEYGSLSSDRFISALVDATRNFDQAVNGPG